jgi:hypothetical protein
MDEMFRECSFEVDHSTINRRVLAYAAVIESFNGRLRDELLNKTLFLSLSHA